ncbi:hypothetical protein MUK42_27797 [Musa troglodytarum]|uniref:Uncharacterized protein n=1 Tax=Musa troglodytarum TaxID=320322 RepID=A0A9E7F1T7_9LILI|nr:hypothetical protein MUK42_27797 [Musa troglodytarum]
MTKGSRRGNKLLRYIKAPYRALLRARDSYVNSMAGCAGRAQRGPTIIAMPRTQSRSFHRPQMSSGEDDINDLIRAASRSRLRSVEGAAVPRSRSVAAMRIDEDKPCDFEGDVKVAWGPRNRSCDVVSKRRARFTTSAISSIQSF